MLHLISAVDMQWQIRHISAMQEALHLPEFEVEGILW